MARPLALLGVIAGLLVGIFLWRFRSHEVVAPPASVASGSAVVAARHEAEAPPAAGSAKPKREHVGRLASLEERRAILARIENARRAQQLAAQVAAQAPELPAEDHSHDLERASPKLQAALKEAIPILAECYTGGARQKRPTVQLVLSGDEESTLIEPEVLKDATGQPLAGELENCLRGALESLELPPLGATEPIQLEYSFRFDDE